MALKDDHERARAWWVRRVGYLSPADDVKVDGLAEEFSAVRAEATTAAMRATMELVRVSASSLQALDAIAKAMRQEVPIEVSVEAVAKRNLFRILRELDEKNMLACTNEAACETHALCVGCRARAMLSTGSS